MRKLIAAAGSLAVLAGGTFYLATPAFAADASPTVDELTGRPWFVKRDGDWFKYAKHNWYEQRREATYTYQYARTIEHPGGSVEQAKYEIQRPYYTVEHKQVNDEGNQAVKDWLVKIGAEPTGGGWWAIPDQVIRDEQHNFNPLTVADTGTVSMSLYGGPSVTVRYRKTQDLTFEQPGSGAFHIAQSDPLYWNGTSWVRGSGNAAWVTDAPEGGKQYDTRTVPDPDKPAWDETVYATEGGGETTNRAEAAWLTQAPEGPGWEQVGEGKATYPEWNDDDPWYQVEGYDWALGKDPTASTPEGKEQPDYYQGYNEETQRFRPVVKKWKVTLPTDAETPLVTPPTNPPTVIVPPKEPIKAPADPGEVLSVPPKEAIKAPADPGEVLPVPPPEASRLSRKAESVEKPPAEAVKVPVRPEAIQDAVVPTAIDAGL